LHDGLALAEICRHRQNKSVRLTTEGSIGCEDSGNFIAFSIPSNASNHRTTQPMPPQNVRPRASAKCGQRKVNDTDIN
jgi:hypothetical protein